MIRLFTTIYPEKNKARRSEYRKCLRLNAECSSIDEICLLSEGGEELLPESSKIKLRRVWSRPTYDQYFEWISAVAADDDVSILANTDIYFDNQLSLFCHWQLSANMALALSRWNIKPHTEPALFNRNDSQDVWIFRGPLQKINGDFCVGVPRCDNRLLYELKQAGYEVINPSFSIRAFHLHEGLREEYHSENMENFVEPPYAYLWPQNLWSLPRTLSYNFSRKGARILWRFDRRKFSNLLLVRVLRKFARLINHSAQFVLSAVKDMLQPLSRPQSSSLAAQTGLSRDQALFRKWLCSHNKFLVSHRASGLGDCILAVAHGWLYCKKTGRELIVDLTESLYMADPQENAANRLIMIPDEFQGVKIHCPQHFTWNLRKIIGSPWIIQQIFAHYLRTLYLYDVFSNRFAALHFSFPGQPRGYTQVEERGLIETGENPGTKFLTFRGCHSEHLDSVRSFIRAIRPSAAIQGRISDIRSELPKVLIGCHIRYYDPSLKLSNHTPYWQDFESAITEIIQLLNHARKIVGIDAPIILCTDSGKVREKLSTLISGLVSMDKNFGSCESGELHEQKLSSSGDDAVTEMFLLAESDVLVRYPPSRSWFSEIAAAHVPLEFVSKEYKNIRISNSKLDAKGTE